MIVLQFVHIFGVFIVDIFKDRQVYLLERIIYEPVDSLVVEHELKVFLENSPTFAGFLELFWISFYSYLIFIQVFEGYLEYNFVVLILFNQLYI